MPGICFVIVLSILANGMNINRTLVLQVNGLFVHICHGQQSIARRSYSTCAGCTVYSDTILATYEFTRYNRGGETWKIHEDVAAQSRRLELMGAQLAN